MKKKIIGIAAAALLLGSSIGYAASSSLIGAKVTGLFSVEQNGKKIADAVIINGSAYVPVRAMSEATGTGLAVEGKRITIEKVTEPAPAVPGETAQSQPAVTPAPVTVDTAKLQEKVTSLETRIQVLKEAVQQAETTSADLKTEAEQAARKSYIAELNKRIADSEAELTQVKAQLGE